MREKEGKSKESSELRQRAEEIAQKQAVESSKDPQDFKPEEIQQLLHELRVHQIELEAQNDELRRTQDDLKHALSRYFDLYDLAPVGYMTLSEKGIIQESNLTAANLLGLQREELVEQPFSRFIFREDQDQYYFHNKALFDTKQPQNCELRLLKTDGTHFWGSLTGAVAKDSDGLEICRLVISDITAQIEQKAALLESEKKFRTAVQNAPYPTMIQAEDGEVIAVNSVWTEITGYTHEDIPTLSQWLKKAYGRGHLEVQTGVKDLFNAGGRKEEGEFTVRTKDGTNRIWLFSSAPLGLLPDGRRHIITMANDITDRVSHEQEQLKRLAELEALEKITEILRYANDENEAMPLLLNHTLEALELTAGSILLFDPKTNIFRKSASVGWFDLIDEKPPKNDEGIGRAVLTSGETYIANEFESDPGTNQAVIDVIPPGWGGVCVPIQNMDEILGVFYLSCKLPRQIQPDEVRFLESIAKIAGITLHRMSLLEDALQKVDNLKAQQKIFQAIASSYDLQLMLDIISVQALTLLPADAVSLLLYEPHSHDLVYSASSGFQRKQYQQAKGKLGAGYAGRAALEKVTIHLESIEGSTPPFERETLLEDEGFITYTAVPLVAKGQIKGVIEVFHRSPIDLDREWDRRLETLASQTAVAIEDQLINERKLQDNLKLTHAYEKTIESWGLALNLRDEKIGSYSQRELDMALKLAGFMGVSEEDLVHFRHGVVLHDIGKLGIPDDILIKPAKLTDDEWVVMKKHPRLAYNLLSPIDFLRPALDIPFSHHEKWDGTGYPQGLKGKAIPLFARIFAVVDVWDALQSDRPFREAWSEAKTLAYIQEKSGSHFDPEVVEAMFKILQESSE